MKFVYNFLNLNPALAADPVCVAPFLAGIGQEGVSLIIPFVFLFYLYIIKCVHSFSNYFLPTFIYPPTVAAYARVAIYIIMLCYTAVTDAVLSILNCVNIDGDYVLFQYPTVKCYPAEGFFIGWLAWAVITLVFVLLGVPVSLFCLRLYAARLIAEDDEVRTRTMPCFTTC